MSRNMGTVINLNLTINGNGNRINLVIPNAGPSLPPPLPPMPPPLPVILAPTAKTLPPVRTRRPTQRRRRVRRDAVRQVATWSASIAVVITAWWWLGFF